MIEVSDRAKFDTVRLNAGEVNKNVLSAGTGILPEFLNGSKILFHFQTEKCDQEHTVIDDTRKMGRPMEFILGKQFKLEVWESCVKTMNLKEIAEFTVEKGLVANYPWVSKMVRSAFGKDKGKHASHDDERPGHCCGMMGVSQEGMGHKDLDELVKNPQNLKFIIELLQVIKPGEYEKETWEMDDQEKLDSLPRLKEEGNTLYQEKRFEVASLKYAEALGRLEQLTLKEKPGDEEWLKLEKMKIPFLLNYSQCKLLLDDYYPVIEHTTTVLRLEPDNVKALFRRAKAHVGAWNPEEARRDYERIQTLDVSLNETVVKQLKKLDEEIKRKNEEDRVKLMGKLF